MSHHLAWTVARERIAELRRAAAQQRLANPLRRALAGVLLGAVIGCAAPTAALVLPPDPCLSECVGPASQRTALVLPPDPCRSGCVAPVSGSAD
jgi:hypothetical protein